MMPLSIWSNNGKAEEMGCNVTFSLIFLKYVTVHLISSVLPLIYLILRCSMVDIAFVYSNLI